MDGVDDVYEQNTDLINELKNPIKTLYEMAKNVLQRYLEMDERNYEIVACWLVASLFHKSFPTFPYLFINASKQSGKSRLLRLCSFMTNGTYTVNITEPVLFRKNDALYVDEIENIGKKEAAGLRELLNVAYKRGGVVERVHINKKTGEITIERFPLYRPIALANINGMDDVLEDRSIVINLQRSYSKEITRRLELFELDDEIVKFRNLFLKLSNFSVDSVVSAVLRAGGVYIQDTLKRLFYTFNTNYTNCTNYTNNTNYTNYTNSTNYTNYTNYTNNTNNTNCTNYTNNIDKLIEMIERTDLIGRDIEIFLPLLIIAANISEENLKRMIEIAINYSKKRSETNINENRDYIAVGFTAAYCSAYNIDNSFVKIKKIIKKFADMNEDEKWMTIQWYGRFIKRLGDCVIERRRVAAGTEIRFDVEKLKAKAIKMGFDIEKLSADILNHTAAYENGDIQ